MPTTTDPPDFRAPIDPGVTTSAPFVPTLEQAHHSATCAALYSRGATERQAIDFLYRETVELHARLIKIAENTAHPMRIMLDADSTSAAAYARGRDDERARCSAHARRLAGRAFSWLTGYPDVLATAEAISSGKAAT